MDPWWDMSLSNLWCLSGVRGELVTPLSVSLQELSRGESAWLILYLKGYFLLQPIGFYLVMQTAKLPYAEGKIWDVTDMLQDTNVR